MYHGGENVPCQTQFCSDDGDIDDDHVHDDYNYDKVNDVVRGLHSVKANGKIGKTKASVFKAKAKAWTFKAKPIGSEAKAFMSTAEQKLRYTLRV